jgi:hypothetical protein
LCRFKKIATIQSFKGKPPATKHTPDGLPQIVIVPTGVDDGWRFSDSPVASDNEYLDMMQWPSDTRSAHQRLDDCVRNSDSKEIGVQCFDGNGWPEKTDLRCWWCLHQFDTRPFPCPIYQRASGVLQIRGVFCGPSCAKAWAWVDGRFTNPRHVDALIDALARKRGFCPPGKKYLYIPAAPPRTALNTFCGSDGLTIEQFRGLCAEGYDVLVLHPPYITEKQVIVAECEKMARAVRHGRVAHVDNPDDLMLSAADFARRRKTGLEIFAGVGVKRLTDYLDRGQAAQVSAAVPDAAQQTQADCGGAGHRGKIKKPFPKIEPTAKPILKKKNRV